MDTTREPHRRQFFARIVKTIQAAIGGTLGIVLGGSIVSPSLARREERWLPGASLSGLAENAPTPIALRVVREDGYSQIIERRVVFLVKTGESSVTALDPTCTHLGCRVSWDAEARELLERAVAGRAALPPLQAQRAGDALAALDDGVEWR